MVMNVSWFPQIQRPPGVSFEEETHPTGKSIYYGRLIPSRGAWFEIKYDLNDVLIRVCGSPP